MLPSIIKNLDAIKTSLLAVVSHRKLNISYKAVRTNAKVSKHINNIVRDVMSVLPFRCNSRHRASVQWILHLYEHFGDVWTSERLHLHALGLFTLCQCRPFPLEAKGRHSCHSPPHRSFIPTCELEVRLKQSQAYVKAAAETQTVSPIPSAFRPIAFWYM